MGWGYSKGKVKLSQVSYGLSNIPFSVVGVKLRRV